MKEYIEHVLKGEARLKKWTLIAQTFVCYILWPNGFPHCQLSELATVGHFLLMHVTSSCQAVMC